MNALTLFLLAAALSVVEARVERNPFQVMLFSAHRNRLDPHTLEKVCTVCKSFFEDVKQELGEAAEITRDNLTKAVKAVCKRLPHDFPAVAKFCDVLSPKVVDHIYHFIKDVEQRVQPEHDCQLLHLCPLEPPTSPAPPTSTAEVPTDEPRQ